MKIKAEVHNITKLKDYFFVVPDYQREYVWKVDDQVDQFLTDLNEEFDSGAKTEDRYFIGSVIIVKNGKRYDVIDGQQRLTTLILMMCAFRDVMKNLPLDDVQLNYLKAVSEWLSTFDVDAGKVQPRLELQYEESKDHLANLIQGKPYDGELTGSIRRMRSAYERIRSELKSYESISIESLIDFTKFFLTRIEMVVIESETLSSALKIFETINQRGASLNAMDLVKNLLFRQASDDDFSKIKLTWKKLTDHLLRAGEEDKPLRFLRYFLMARYHDGIIREDDIYKWIISTDGKATLGYESDPLRLAKEMERSANLYADLAVATAQQSDGGIYPDVTRIGYINKYKSRQHLILLLALDPKADVQTINFLAQQIESFFFFNITLGVQAKDNERVFAQWASTLRGLSDMDAVKKAIEKTLLRHLRVKFSQFNDEFLTLRHSAYEPGYRLRYVLGQLENTLRHLAGEPPMGLNLINAKQVEHVLPQTPAGSEFPKEYAKGLVDYQSSVYKLGNVTLLEPVINQAVNNCNNLETDWYTAKLAEYSNSELLSTKMLDAGFSVGQNTMINKAKAKLGLGYTSWNPTSIEHRQKVLLDLALETWRINGQRLDQVQVAV